jgi:hypothetical protein
MECPVALWRAPLLVLIWRGLGELDAHTCSHLPASWRTLYLLAQLDPKVLLDLIGEDKIHPGLTIQEARALLTRAEDRQRGRRPQVQRRLASFKDFIHSTLIEWTAAERDHVRAELLKLAHELASNAPVTQCEPVLFSFRLNNRRSPTIDSHSL